VAAAKLSDGRHILVAGSTSGNFDAFVWLKEPIKPAPETTAGPSSSTTLGDWMRVAERSVLIIACSILILLSFPTVNASNINRRVSDMPQQDLVGEVFVTVPSANIVTRTIYETATRAAPTSFLANNNPNKGMVHGADATVQAVTIAPHVVTQTVTALRMQEVQVTTVTQLVTVSLENSTPTAHPEIAGDERVEAIEWEGA
ncbi:hypothetical protein DXG01_015324, partial [Tephrocybe rancida]